MLKSCKYCGRIVDEKHRCSKKPIYKKANPHITKFRNSKEWKLKRKDIRQRDKQLCRMCYLNNRYVYNEIEVHHIEPLVFRFDLRLEDSNLISLCRMCHEDAEKGKISKEELRKTIPPNISE